MSILTTKRTWKRKPAQPELVDLRRLTPSQHRNITRVLAHLAIEFGGPKKLAAAMGRSPQAWEKVRAPGRPKSLRTILAVARLAGVGIDDVLAGRWKRHACEECGCVGAV